MIDRTQLLSDLQGLVRKLEEDLQGRIASAEVPEVGETLRSEYDRAKQAERTAQTFNEWVSDYRTQMAVDWVLSATFARFLEDNGLVEPPRLSGVGENLQRSRDQHELYFRQHPAKSDRDYLLWVFEELAKLPGGAEIFGRGNLLWELPNWLSGDAAGEILQFFQTISPNTGALVHNFADPVWDTRFLGDLYQDLSEAARKKYALLQTPIFVEEFILDRTLEPALNEFQVEFQAGQFRLIDPACGSGHFLLGAFERLLGRWLKQEPGTNPRVLAQRSLDAVHGVDVNPFAIAIARFRLLLAAMKASDVKALRNAPDFKLNLACGDSLLHGDWRQLSIEGIDPQAHTYSIEDVAALMRLLVPKHYHVVVGNPPYIVPKDKKQNEEYRKRYDSCYRQYSMAVPFMERIFQLAVPKGFTGQITANSFMKREFGKKLIEEFFPKVDLTHVIDTSGAYIPGHGTPTVILFGRNREPVAKTIRTVMGIRGEPSTPEIPDQGLVWSAILKQVDIEGSESEFVSVADSQRDLFHKHPWSIGGGGATDLKTLIESLNQKKLQDCIETICSLCLTRADDTYLMPSGVLSRHRVKPEHQMVMVQGEQVRDWGIYNPEYVLFPYDDHLQPVSKEEGLAVHHFLWAHKETLWRRRELGGDHRELNRTWWEWNRFLSHRFVVPNSIAFAFVATHNHFVLDRGGKVFKQSAPVIKLPASATEDDHLVLLGLLNSSIACFWMQQVFHNKGRPGADAAAADEPWEFRFEHDGTKLQPFPLPSERPIKLAKKLDELAQRSTQLLPEAILSSWSKEDTKPLQTTIQEAHAKWRKIRSQMIALQEELDWQCYRLYGILEEDLTYKGELPDLEIGQRAFEIVLARQIEANEIKTVWFERLNGTPILEIPSNWTEDYQALIQKRIHLIENDRNIGLLEQFQHKRRWQVDTWESQLERALQNWLLDRLESYFDLDGRMNDEGKPTAKIIDPALISTAKLADIARQDPEFLQVGELYTHNPGFDVLKLVNDLVEVESVPLLPVLRYKSAGLLKRQDWEQTWARQRQEDAIDARTQLPKDDPNYLDILKAKTLKAQEIGDIPVPPKYANSDFQKTHYWKLRGKLDVPKERWVSFPYCEADNGQLVIAWAGYDHLQLALAISAYFVHIKEEIGGSGDSRLFPLLGCLIELLPWLKQWHNDLDPAYNLKMGDYIEGFIQDEARQLNQTPEEIRNWQPPKTKAKRRR